MSKKSSAFIAGKHTVTFGEAYCGPIDTEDFQQGRPPKSGNDEVTYDEGDRDPK